MQVAQKIIGVLNEALKEELTSINQSFLNAEMCENHVDWLEAQILQIREIGYERYLGKQIENAE